ncbi:23S rRNA pseudouridine955/2504/2580 synthase [Caloranaerobacter azorensis DSM 13643]|uniref:Pseudouridine synthase n=1 Tax=Caloranaerobacter azorensis DSM 13643 TaxID=1121264 RepID=A0A1M5USC7_9FIRM|nr:RluA family pseudouridine synthase [Caloranaerobacter azorensis]SHH65881.1 23S rRNA pseudouridine955/2504/2580 synthase [Caloranaerobacter azorensis DSM 13643]
MKEIIISKNESNQRLDRFLKKYMPRASKGFIYKMLRKKRIKLNGKKAKPNDILKEGDILNLYLAEDTINKFKEEIKIENRKVNLDIVYEDENIILINKPKGILSHSDRADNRYDVVNMLISYLYGKGEYNPNEEKTFTPSICNRLDRNTSGIIIGAKNFMALQLINKAIREKMIKKYYKCIVKGRVDKDFIIKGYMLKDAEKNRADIFQNYVNGAKKIETGIKVLKSNDEYSLLEINLITGRTHQIRAHLSYLGHPIIGDMKYGDIITNRFFKEKYNLYSQFLHSNRIEFNGLEDCLSYLNGKSFIADLDDLFEKIIKELF